MSISDAVSLKIGRMVDGFGASEVVVESLTHNALIGIAEDSQAP